MQDEEMPEAMAGQGPRVQIPDMHRPDTRFRLELGDRLCALLVEVGVLPVLMRDIREDPMLLELWREMSRYDASYASYHQSYQATSSEEGCR
jgi:hypothetical protein